MTDLFIPTNISWVNKDKYTCIIYFMSWPTHVQSLYRVLFRFENFIQSQNNRNIYISFLIVDTITPNMAGNRWYVAYDLSHTKYMYNNILFRTDKLAEATIFIWWGRPENHVFDERKTLLHILPVFWRGHANGRKHYFPKPRPFYPWKK